MSIIIDSIKNRAAKNPDEIAIVTSGNKISNQALWKEVTRLSQVFLEQFPDKTRPIAIALDNCIELIAIDLALLNIGIPAIVLPPFFSDEQVKNTLLNCGAIALINNSQGETINVFGKSLQIAPTNNAAVSLPINTAKITYTSGSTGAPKGVCLSLEHMETLSVSLIDTIGGEFAKTHFAVLPLGVLLENVAGLYTTLIAGGKYVVFSLKEIGFANPFAPEISLLISAIKSNNATSLILVPEILRALMAGMARANIKLDSLEFIAVGGARVANELFESARKLGLPVYEGYGLSECSSVVALNTPKDTIIGSAGKILPHLDVEIADDGEIIVRHKTLENCFLGYVGENDAPKELKTGDIGNVSNGNLYISGRKKNIIINSFGRNISPEWVEGEFIANPNIGQIFVYGDAAPSLSALIVPSRPDFKFAEIERAVFEVNKGLPDYAKIKEFHLTTPFLPANGELTDNGRFKRSAIFERRFKNARELKFYHKLISDTILDAQRLMSVPQIQAGLKGDISLETYIAYLTQAYHHVKFTVPLMEAARSKIPVDNKLLHSALDEYVEEETGHENWILADIKNAGGDMLKARDSKPNPATELMVSYVYDYINRINPVGFFGMVFVLEGTSVQLATKGAGAVAQKLNLGPECFTYLTSHGDLDISHLGFFEGLVNQIIDERDQDSIIHVAKMVFKLFGEMFASIPLTNAQITTNQKELADAI